MNLEKSLLIIVLCLFSLSTPAANPAVFEKSATLPLAQAVKNISQALAAALGPSQTNAG